MAIQVQGEKRLIRKLRELPRAAQNKVIRPALRKGARLFQRAIQSKAPVLTGLMRKSLNVRAMKAKKGKLGSLVGYRNTELLTRKSKSGARYFYPAAVEYGHGDYEGEHFMREGFDSNRPAAESLVLTEMKLGIEREAAKA